MERKSELPHIQIDIKGTRLTALIDSGSAATLISSSAWSQIGDKPILRPGAAIQLRSVTGNILPNQGETELPVTIGPQTTKVKAQVISGIPFQCILGIDFIRTANLILRAAENCVQLGQERVPITSRCGNYDGPRAVSSVQALTLDPQQGAIVTVQSGLARKGRQLFEFVPLNEESKAHPSLKVTELLGETSETGLFQIQIANPTDHTVHLPAGTLLGSTVPIEGTVATVNFDSQLPSPSAPDSQQCNNQPWPLNSSHAGKLPPHSPHPNGAEPRQNSKGKSVHGNSRPTDEPSDGRPDPGSEQKQHDSAGSKADETAGTMDQLSGSAQKRTIRMANAITQSAFAPQDKQKVGSHAAPGHFEGREQRQPEPVPTTDVADKGRPMSQQKEVTNPDESGEPDDAWIKRWTSREAFLQLFDLKHLTPEVRAQVEKLLCRYESIFASHDFDLGQIQIATHTIKIQPNSAPVYCRPYRCSEFERKELHRQLEQMLEHGLIEPAYDGYRSPVLLVKKAGATSASDQYRLVQSFIRLNAVTEPIRYPLPNMQQVLEDLGRHRGYFTSMDMTKSFWQLRIRPECAKYASFTTELGDFTPRVVLMGLKGASETLQRVIDQIYAPVLATGKVRCYLDDLVCATPDEAEHFQTLEDVFKLAKQYGVKYKPSKTKLFRRSIKLLGHVISSEGIRVDDAKISAITRIAPPTNKTETRAFLGLTAFYRAFAPGYAKIALPLINLLKKNVPFLFDDKCMHAFNSLKTILTSAPVLRYPDFSGKYPFQVYTDASDKAIGAVLQQTFPDGSHPIAYASRVLQPSEICLPIYARESLAVVFAIAEKFRKYLQGRHFTLFCDNAAVTYLLKSVKEPKHASARLTRDAIKLLDFDFTINHIPSKDLPHADGLTRLSWDSLKREAGLEAEIDLDAPKEPVCAVMETSLLPYSLDEWRQRQKSDEELNAIIEALKQDHVSKGPIRYKDFGLDKEGVLVHRSKGREIRVVPKDWRHLILQGYHDGPMGGHQGTRAMLAKMRGKYYWPSVNHDVLTYVHQCPKCEQRENGFRGRAPLQENYQATRPFQKVSIDFMTGLPVTDRGNTVLLTAICCFSRWVELIPLPNRSAREVAMALTRSIFFRHGCCQIVSDSGKEFIGEIMSHVYELLGIDARTSTFYHPASQGKIERTHRVIANILAKFVSSGQTDWDLFVSPCMMAMNSAIHSATGFSPYFLLHGRDPTLPPDALLLNEPPPQWRDYPQFVENLLRHTYQAFTEARQQIGKLSAKNRDRVNAKARPRNIEVGQRVLLYTPKVSEGEKRKLAMYWRPGFEIVQKFGNVNYLIEEIATKKKQLVHVDRIKVQRSSIPTTDHPRQPTDLSRIPVKPAHRPGSHERARAAQIPGAANAEAAKDAAHEDTLNWEWEPETIGKRSRGGISDAGDDDGVHQPNGPDSDTESSDPSGPASVRSIPATERASVSLSSSDGLHLSTEVSPNYSSESDQEESAPTAASVPPDCSRRYPARCRHPPDRWSPPP